MKRIIVSKACAASGICAAMSRLMEEGTSGHGRPAGAGIITEEEAERFEAVVQACPSGAISLESYGRVKSRGAAGIAELKQLAAREFEGYRLEKPSSSNYTFKSDSFLPEFPSVSGQNRYDYKSFDAAERAGLREFDRVMYSQRKALVQQMLVEYRHRKLRPYNCYEHTTGNFFYDTVQALETKLQGLVVEATDLTGGRLQLPEGFDRLSVPVDFSDNGSFEAYQMRNLERIIADQIVGRLDSLSSYSIDTDDMDIDDNHYRCSYNINSAIDTFRRELANETEMVVNDFVYDHMERLTAQFSRGLQQELKQKVETLAKALDRV